MIETGFWLRRNFILVATDGRHLESEQGYGCGQWLHLHVGGIWHKVDLVIFWSCVANSHHSLVSLNRP